MACLAPRACCSRTRGRAVARAARAPRPARLVSASPGAPTSAPLDSTRCQALAEPVETETSTLLPAAAITGAVLLNVAVGSLYAWSAFVAPLEAAMALSRAKLSATFSLATVCFASTMFFGARAHAWAPTPVAAAAALVIGGVGIAAAGLAKTYPVLLLGWGLCFGFANGIGYGVSLATANLMGQGKYAALSRGVATGLAVGGYVVTPVFLAPYLKSTIAAIGPHAVLVQMGVAFLALAPAIWALYAVGKVQIPMPQPPPEAAVDQRARERAVTLRLQLGCMTGALAGLMTISHAVGIMNAFGGLPAQAAVAVSLASLANWGGRILSGMMGDVEDGPRQVLVGGSALTAAMLAFLALLPAKGLPFGPPGMAPFGALAVIGMCYGAVMTAFPAATSRLLGQANFSRIYGRVFSFWGIAGITGPLMAGYMYDLWGSYNVSCAIAAAIALTSSAIATGLPSEAEGK